MPRKSQWQGSGPSSRTERLEIRLSAGEKADIERRAKEAGRDVSDYVRHRLLLDRAVPSG